MPITFMYVGAELKRSPSLKAATVKELYDTEVFAALLGFCALDQEQRAAFMLGLNDFLYISPQQQRRQISDWASVCLTSPSPAVRKIAESAAIYVAKPVRKKRRS